VIAVFDDYDPIFPYTFFDVRQSRDVEEEFYEDDFYEDDTDFDIDWADIDF
jgi:hypothetical protein